MSGFFGNVRDKVSKFIDERKEKAAAAEHARRSSIIDQKSAAINSQRDWISGNFLQEINKQNELKISDFDGAFNYFEKLDDKKILDKVEQLKSMQQRDSNLLGGSGSYRFEVYSKMVLNNIDSGARNRIIQSAIDEHTMRVSGNSLLTGIAAARGNYGLAAMAASEGAANKAKAGYHNEAIRILFQQSVFNVGFFKSAADMNDVELKYTRLAQRIYNFTAVDRKISGPLLFAMVFKGGECRVVPIEGDKYDRAAPAEFMSRFGGYVMSQRDAAQKLDDLINSNKYVKLLSNMRKISCYVTDKEANWSLG